MTGYNLPPGCEDWHLPGNRPEDERAEMLLYHFYEVELPKILQGLKSIYVTDMQSLYLDKLNPIELEDEIEFLVAEYIIPSVIYNSVHPELEDSLRTQEKDFFSEIYLWARKLYSEVVEAWEQTLMKWELSVLGEWGGKFIGCGLCLLYRDLVQEECEVCPVAQYTGLDGCRNTPYNQAKRGKTVIHSLSCFKELRFLLRLKRGVV